MVFIETDKVELKEKINDSLPKEIEAFLNTDGGIIYIGINNDGEVIGVSNIDEALRKISDIITDKIEPNPLVSIKLGVEIIENKFVITILVNKGYLSLYSIKKFGYSPSGCHYRIGSTCKSMTLEMIKKRSEKGVLNNDLLLTKDSYYEDLKFSKLKMLLLDSGYHLDELTFENNLKLRINNNTYNYLGELLADNNSTSLIFAKFKGLTKATFKERSDYGNQCIVTAFLQIKERLKLENICKTITSPRPRKDIYLYDMDAVNEALLNAIIHNDYLKNSPQVSFFDDRIEIISFGGLPIDLTIEDFFNGVSKPRNKHLMDIFVRLKIAEQTGHGIPTIVSKYGKEVFTITENYINVTIPFNKEVIRNHGEISGAISGVNDQELDDKEKLVLNKIEENHHYTTKEISETLDIPFRSVQRYLANLKNKCIIERVGANKNGYWEIITGRI